MLYREIIAARFEIHTQHINTLCGQNVEFLNVKPGGTYIEWPLGFKNPSNRKAGTAIGYGQPCFQSNCRRHN